MVVLQKLRVAQLVAIFHALRKTKCCLTDSQIPSVITITSHLNPVKNLALFTIFFNINPIEAHIYQTTSYLGIAICLRFPPLSHA